MRISPKIRCKEDMRPSLVLIDLGCTPFLMKPECWTGHTLDHQVLSMTPLQTSQNEDLSQQRTVKFIVNKKTAKHKSSVIMSLTEHEHTSALHEPWMKMASTASTGSNSRSKLSAYTGWASTANAKKEPPGLGWGEATHGSSCQTSRCSWVSWIFMGFLSIEHRSIKHRSTSQDQKLSIKDRGQLNAMKPSEVLLETTYIRKLHMGIYPQAI